MLSGVNIGPFGSRVTPLATQGEQDEARKKRLLDYFIKIYKLRTKVDITQKEIDDHIAFLDTLDSEKLLNMESAERIRLEELKLERVQENIESKAGDVQAENAATLLQLQQQKQQDEEKAAADVVARAKAESLTHVVAISGTYLPMLALTPQQTLDVSTLQNITSYLDRMDRFNREYYEKYDENSFGKGSYGGNMNEVTHLIVIGFLLSQLTAIKTIAQDVKDHIEASVAKFTAIFAPDALPIRDAIIEKIKSKRLYSSMEPKDRSFLYKINLVNSKS